jgi:BASS family bile acid:Na+ symporter
MAVIGLGLTPEDFRRVTRQPGVVALATVGQLVVLPLIGVALVRCLRLSPAVGKGVLLVVACPAGSMADLYNHLARARVALSVTLTAVSCLAAVLTMPAVLTAFRVLLGEGTTLVVPALPVVGQLLLTLIVPVCAGMAVRRRWPDAVERRRGGLFALSVGALAVLLGFVVAQEADHFADGLAEIAAAGALLTALALAAGWATGWAGGEGGDPITVAMVFAVRNVGVATAVAVTVLGRTEFAAFAAAYFLTQTPLLLAAALVHRRLGTAAPGPNGVE